MLTIEKKHIIHTMSREHKPVAKIASGEEICFVTYDCYFGNLLEEGTDFSNVNRALNNPATGPVYVEGAQVGDMLKIEVENIELDEIGILDIGPGSGALKGYFEESVIKRIPVREKVIYYNEHTKLPVRPMIGVIGVAPAEEAVSTMSPMDHGGNMDCNCVEPGAVLYLPVFQQGALLSMGDVHAIMGDGEVGNCGLEIGSKTTLRVSVEKDMAFSYPLIENKTQWMTIAYGESLDEAAQKCCEQMFLFLKQQFELDNVDAGMLLDMVGDLKVCQIVNPYKTCRMEIPKKVIEDIKKS